MKYAKLNIKVADSKAPYFIGSQVRGAFGYALKSVVCINPTKECNGCESCQKCLYYEFYENKNVYHKYRFDFLLGNSNYDFDFYLFGDVIGYLPYCVTAFYRLFTQIGLGKERRKFVDFEMQVNGRSCYKNGSLKVLENFSLDIKIPPFEREIVLEFLTPLRIKKYNSFLRYGEGLELKDLINSIYQRQMKILGRDFKKFPYEIKGEIYGRDLRFLELSRHSNRQKVMMNLGGLVGRVCIKNLNKESYEVLRLGEYLGVGKQCVFGLGKIRVGEIEK